MPLIIANATETTGGNKFAALDQAEPDSLDFEVLGNVGRSGVVSGLGVTSNSSNTTVNVAAGVIAWNGAAYSVSASPTLFLGTGPDDNRFDLIIARVTGGVAALVVVSGANSPTNPTLPKSRNVITGAFNAAQHIDLDTDVVIAAVYRTGTTTITNSRILDKRAMQASGIVLQGTSVPNSGVGTGPGNLYFKSNTVNGDGTDSGVYVKLANGEWIGLAKDVGLHIPIGGMIEWPTSAPVPPNFAEPTGQALATSTYVTLHGVYGWEHGGTPGGGTFLLPDYTNVHKRGTANTALVGTALGADSVELTTAHLPPHTHNIAHTHEFPHVHSIAHGHAATTEPSGAHVHDSGTLTTAGVNGWNPVLRAPSYAATPYVTAWTGDGVRAPNTGEVSVRNLTNGQFTVGWFGQGMAIANTDAALVNSGNTGPASPTTHVHTVTVVAHSGNTSSQSSSITSAASPALSGPQGGGSPVSLIPASRYVRNIIRVS